MLGPCSQLGTNSPISCENSESNANGIMLFGVRVIEGSFRKCASMNNLAQFDHPQDSTAACYASDDVVHPSARTRDRKRGVPWTEEEHKLFLLGLQKVGKGDWRGISRNFVKTRTPTQVASHAQKYFLRRNNHNNRRRRRSSLFDITTHTFTSSTTEDVIFPVVPMASKMADLNLNHTTTESLPLSLSLKVSVPGRQASAYEGISGSFNSGSGDSIISVA